MHGTVLTPASFIAMVAAVILAAATQRVTGVGFALVSAPLLVLGAGPVTGILLANLLSLATNLIVLAQTWRQVELRRVILLAVPAICCVPIGQAVAGRVQPAALMISIGLMVLTGLALMLFLPRTNFFAGRIGAIVAGAGSGFMNVTAGVGGPAIALYAAASRWEQKTFVGSVQLYFAALNAASVTAKGLPALAWQQIALLSAALVVGLVIGNFAVRLVPYRRARQATLALAALGATATIARGFAAL